MRRNWASEALFCRRESFLGRAIAGGYRPKTRLTGSNPSGAEVSQLRARLATAETAIDFVPLTGVDHVLKQNRTGSPGNYPEPSRLRGHGIVRGDMLDPPPSAGIRTPEVR
jgi:hypothetical protein